MLRRAFRKQISAGAKTCSYNTPGITFVSIQITAVGAFPCNLWLPRVAWNCLKQSAFRSAVTECLPQLHMRGCIQKFPDWPPAARLHVVQLSATRCSCVAILWVRLVSFAAITLCVASRRVFVAVISLSTQSGNFWIRPHIYIYIYIYIYITFTIAPSVLKQKCSI
jgi:hypothetical protein